MERPTDGRVMLKLDLFTLKYQDTRMTKGGWKPLVGFDNI